MAWLPVFFLYFSERVSLQQILVLEAAYYASIVTLEVPTGYFSDRYGRRLTLLGASGALSAAYAVFCLADGFATLLVAQLLLGLGMSLRSGTETALHYDTLVALGQRERFAEREAIAERNGLAALALFSLLGGLAGLVDLRLPYALSLLGALASVAIVLRFVEPSQAAELAPAERSFARQMLRCTAYLRLPAVAWLFGFYVVLDMLMHVPYEFYQPYLRLLEGDVLAPDSSPAVSGALLAATMALAAWGASRSVRLRERFGLRALLLGALAVQAAIVVAMAAVLSVWAAVLVLLRNLPDAVAHAPYNAALGEHLSSGHRATFLSLTNLSSRIALAGLLALLAALLPAGAVADWPTLSELLRWCALLGMAALAGLALSSRALGRRPPGG